MYDVKKKLFDCLPGIKYTFEQMTFKVEIIYETVRIYCQKCPWLM
jgi:hypothetical protein